MKAEHSYESYTNTVKLRITITVKQYNTQLLGIMPIDIIPHSEVQCSFGNRIKQLKESKATGTWQQLGRDLLQ